MLTRFDKYVLKELVSPFLMGLTVYTFTLLINNILIMMKHLASRNVSAITIAEILLLLMPELLAFTIPMSTLMGILAGLSRMSSDSEIVAMKTMGIKNSRLLKPVMLFSMSTWLISSALIIYIAPESSFQLMKLTNKIAYSAVFSKVKPRTFFTQFPNYVLYFDDIDRKSGAWQNVMLFSEANREKDVVITAKEGMIIYSDKPDTDNNIVLKDAQVIEYDKKEPGKSFSTSFYKSKTEKIAKINPIRHMRRHNHLSLTQLREKIKKKPVSPYDKRKHVRYQKEYFKKFAQPFACLAFAFLALPLGISTKRGGQTRGFIISLGIIFVYYTVSMNIDARIGKMTISPLLGMWITNIFLLIVGAILYYYSAKEKKPQFNFGRKLASVFKKEKIKEKKVLFVLKIRTIKMRFMKIMDMYVGQKLILVFTFIFSSLFAIFFIVTFTERADNAMENNVSMLHVFKYIFYYSPEILGQILPVSALTAVLLTFSWMSKKNEIIAVQVGGISLYRLVAPAVIFGMILSGLAFYIQEQITPASNKLAEQQLNIINKRKTKTEREYNNRWVADESGKIYFYNIFDRKEGKFFPFDTIELDENRQIKTRVHCEIAKWLSPTELLLYNGFERSFGEKKYFRTFVRKTIKIKGGREIFTNKIKWPKYMNISKLSEYIDYLERNGSSTQKKYEANLYYKMAFPFSSIVMVLIAIPFAFSMGKKGALHGIGIAVGASILYWGAIGIAGALGEMGILSPFISGFAPFFCFAGLSIYMIASLKT